MHHGKTLNELDKRYTFELINTVTHMYIYEGENQLYLSAINMTTPSAAVLSNVFCSQHNEKQKLTPWS